MKAVSIICLLAVMLCTAMAADEVKLLYVKSIANCPYTLCSQHTYWTVQVKNVDYQKYVAIHILNPATGLWEDVPLSWLSSPNKYVDIFTGHFALSYIDVGLGKLPLPIEFVVKYSVSGVTYWQKNATDGQNYKVAGDFGAVLTDNNKIFVGDFAPLTNIYLATNSDMAITGTSVYVKSKNDNGAVYKNVTIRLTEDSWKSFKDVQCSFSANAYYGQYSRAANPNSAGYETWYCNLPITAGVPTIEYAAFVLYNVDTKDPLARETVWDNNYGVNYVTDLIWVK